jgi:hypothetical protein
MPAYKSEKLKEVDAALLDEFAVTDEELEDF